MAICPHCERDAGDARFCPVDGTPLAHLSTPPIARELTAGDIVDGRYEIVAELGRGGIGIVYLAKSEALGEIAVKVLQPSSAERQTTVARFAREARLSSRMDHPHVVRVYEFGFDPAGFYYLVMELLDGRSLYELIHREGPLAPARALRLLKQIASALARAHDIGVVHRDMKAENVMIRALDGEHVTVMDFGLSRTNQSWGGAMMTTEGQLVGTPTYMAPEQWRGEKVGPAADIYAFGVLSYEVLTGAPPFEGKNVVELMKAHVYRQPPPLAEGRTRGALPGSLVELVHLCLEKDLTSRPPTMDAVHGQLADELDRLLHMIDADTLTNGDEISDDTNVAGLGRDELRERIRRATVQRAHERTKLLTALFAGVAPPSVATLADGLQEPESAAIRFGTELAAVLQEVGGAAQFRRSREATLRGDLADAAVQPHAALKIEAEAKLGKHLRENDPTLDQAELKAESLRARVDGVQNALEDRHAEFEAALVSTHGDAVAPLREASAHIAALRAQLLRTSR